MAVELRVSQNTGPFCSEQPSDNNFVLTDKLLVLNHARIREQPLDYLINPLPQHTFFSSQHTTDVPLPAQTFPL